MIQMKKSNMIDSYQIVLAGVGGQGIIYLNRVLSKATMDLGYKVYCLEEHGMARRGGSVASYLRFGHDIYTPVIPMGTADLMIGFEVIEAVRQLPVLKSDTKIILNPHIIRPFITTGEYPDKAKLLNYLKKRYKKKELILIDAEQIASDLGSSITMNMVLLGAVCGAGALPIPESSLKDAIKNTSLSQYLDINLEAFESGFEAVNSK
jgi:indolepyruvate ferredoxin oxidoreductase beta subunit